MTRTPIVVVLSGSNGAGKSTTAARLVRGALSVNEFVNADTIATTQGLSAYRPEAAAIAAGRVMLARLCTDGNGAGGHRPGHGGPHPLRVE